VIHSEHRINLDIVGVPCPAAQKHPTPTDNPVIHSEYRIILDIVGVPCPAAQKHPTPTDNPVIHSVHRINLDIVGVPCPAAQEHPTPTDNPVITSEHRINLDIVTMTQRSCLTKQCVTKGFQWFSVLILILFCVAIIALIGCGFFVVFMVVYCGFFLGCWCILYCTVVTNFHSTKTNPLLVED
jgi:hypothetical protein